MELGRAGSMNGSQNRRLVPPRCQLLHTALCITYAPSTCGLSGILARIFTSHVLALLPKRFFFTSPCALGGTQVSIPGLQGLPLFVSHGLVYTGHVGLHSRHLCVRSRTLHTRVCCVGLVVAAGLLHGIWAAWHVLCSSGC